MSDCFNAITLAVWVYVLIPFWIVWGYYWIKDKRDQRRARKQGQDEEPLTVEDEQFEWFTTSPGK
ncbi:MAG: hypothetical protein ACYCDN_08440 [Schaalia turicensis]